MRSCFDCSPLFNTLAHATHSFDSSIAKMSSPTHSLDGPTETHEMKSDLHDRSLDLPPGEAIGHRPEDHDLGQFGYKAELEVSISSTLSVAAY